MLNKGKHLYFNNQPQLQEFVYTSSESYNIRFVGSQRGNYFCIQFLHDMELFHTRQKIAQTVRNTINCSRLGYTGNIE